MPDLDWNWRMRSALGLGRVWYLLGVGSFDR